MAGSSNNEGSGTAAWLCFSAPVVSESKKKLESSLFLSMARIRAMPPASDQPPNPLALDTVTVPSRLLPESKKSNSTSPGFTREANAYKNFPNPLGAQ